MECRRWVGLWVRHRAVAGYVCFVAHASYASYSWELCRNESLVGQEGLEYHGQHEHACSDPNNHCRFPSVRLKSGRPSVVQSD